jgi:type IV pilus assembly protein PilV
LVALVVLSIGLLGLAGLQLTSVTNTRDAYYRTQAIALSYDIADRMRSNLTAVDDRDYDAIAGTEVAACRSTSGCSSSQLAADDVFLWRQSLSTALPTGQGIVCLDSDVSDDSSVAAASDCDGLGNQYAVKVWWDQDRNGALDANRERFVMVFIP